MALVSEQRCKLDVSVGQYSADNAQIKKFEGYAGAAAAIRAICNEVRYEQEKFLSARCLTLEDAKSLPASEKVLLQEQWEVYWQHKMATAQKARQIGAMGDPLK